MVQVRAVEAIVLIVIIVVAIYLIGSYGQSSYKASHKTSTVSTSSTLSSTSTLRTTVASTTTINSSIIPPNVIITYPANLSTVNGLVNITANVVDAAKIRQVQFYIGGNLLWTSNSMPYYYLWNTTGLSAPKYMITVKAYDYSNHTGQANVLVDIGLVQHGK